MPTGTLQDSTDKMTYGAVDFSLPDGYAVTEGSFNVHIHGKNGPQFVLTSEGQNIGVPKNPGDPAGPDNNEGTFPLTEQSIIGRTGKVSVLYNYYNVQSGGWIASVKASPTDATLLAWRVRVLNQLRDADQANYEAGLQKMKDRKAQLEADLGQFDALTLRKMEREEIMKSVLQWLLGPSFQLSPAALQPFLEDPAKQVFEARCNEAWQAIMQYGEFIKFIHNAVEWENVLFFPYPYFWDAMSRWPFKQFLVHPDPEHRAFLRAGCARVVLTIRPGFEQDFSQLVETGSFKAVLGDTHPYVSIGQEIRNFAMTNYEGIPPANPDKNVRPLLYPEQRKAWSEMQNLMLLLEAYSNDPANNPDPQDPTKVNENAKVYPTTAQGLAALNPYLPLQDPAGRPLMKNLPAADPWGNPYVYTSPGLHGDYDLVSYGRDGVEGGDGLDADITSWAEVSVVATWFEYTPTSALDVVVNSALVTQPVPA
jgi:type II secretory pathway pseudopilin PulG